jgi:hypothetical protein
MLVGRALVAAGCAPRLLPQHIARRVAAPADHGDRARQWRVMLALLAVQPKPRRRAVQVAERVPIPGGFYFSNSGSENGCSENPSKFGCQKMNLSGVFRAAILMFQNY